VTAYTSTQTGDWDAPATWGGGGYPGDGQDPGGDTATLAAGHTVTLPAATPITAGTGGATDTAAVTIQAGATLISASDLTLRGDLVIAEGGTYDQRADLVFRPPTGSRYKIEITAGAGIAQWIATGTPAAHVETRTDLADGGAAAWLTSLFLSFATAWDYHDWTDMGDGTQRCMDVRQWNSDIRMRWHHGRLLRYGTQYLEAPGGDGRFEFDFDSLSWHDAQTRFPAIRLQIESDVAVGYVRRIRDSVMAQPVSARAALQDWCADTEIDGLVMVNTQHDYALNPWRQSVRVFLLTEDGQAVANITGTGTQQSRLHNSALCSAGNTNPHIVNGTGLVEDCVFVCDGTPSPEVGDVSPDGEMTIRRCIFTNDSVVITALNVNARITADRCTFAGRSWIAVGEANGDANQLQQLTSSLFVDNPDGLRQEGFFVSQASAVVDYNAFHNQTNPANLDLGTDNSYVGAENQAPWWATGGGYGSATDRGANDIPIDPQLNDTTRNIATWDASMGGPGTIASAAANAATLLGYAIDGTPTTPAAGYTLDAFLAYMREGFAPQNPAVQGAGQGGVDLGAVDYVAGGGAVLLALADSRQAQRADLFDLAQGFTLAAEDLAQAQRAEAVDLAQAFTLSSEDLAQAQRSEPLTLAQAQALAPAVLRQAQRADSLDLGQAYLLALDSLRQAQRAASPELTQAHALVLAELAQAQRLEVLELLHGVVLLPAGARQAQRLEALALAQQQTLVPADVRQAQVLEEAPLQFGVVLAPAGARQAQRLLDIELSALGVLTVEDVRQVQRAELLDLLQGHALALADARQAQRVDATNLWLGVLVTPPDRIAVVRAEDRSVRVPAEDRSVRIH
jgi:hypothetical protein